MTKAEKQAVKELVVLAAVMMEIEKTITVYDASEIGDLVELDKAIRPIHDAAIAGREACSLLIEERAKILGIE